MGHIDQSVMLVFIEGRADADHHFIGAFIGRSHPALAGFQGKRAEFGLSVAQEYRLIQWCRAEPRPEYF